MTTRTITSQLKGAPDDLFIPAITAIDSILAIPGAQHAEIDGGTPALRRRLKRYLVRVGYPLAKTKRGKIRVLPRSVPSGSASVPSVAKGSAA